ncbi:Mu transposase C-terminal domain-containing protein [Roseibium aggregatum]|uniref:Mu transposase C-terminal domain-containing protein n=1 Tax=Roseibium aggregatum TaxID=187304 RepID=UPI0025AD4803|nr:Mu transposase C-terminal domain-containing protein [Roseibium aggregatum]WJS00321.1 Mu transposase C-terminal domain-containing protein [Roseibium aggregatum]
MLELNTNQTASSTSALRIRFAPHSEIIIKGVSYTEVLSDEEFCVLRRVDNPDVYEKFTYVELNDLIAQGLLTEERGAFDLSKQALKIGPNVRLSDLKPEVAELVHFRQFICDEFLKMEKESLASRSDAALEQAIAILHGKWSTLLAQRAPGTRFNSQKTKGSFGIPRPSTVRRWLQKYEAADFNVMALCPMKHKCGNRADRLHPDVRALLRDGAREYASLLKPTMDKVYGNFVEHFDGLNEARAEKGLPALPLPSKAAMRAEIRKLAPYHVDAGRHGVPFAKKKYAYIQGKHDPEWPLQLVEMDEWKVSLQTLLKGTGIWEKIDTSTKEFLERNLGRMQLSAAIDVRTKCILAMQLAPTATTDLAIATLKMAMSDKNDIAKAAGCETPWDMEGRIQMVRVDNGPAYVAGAFSTAAIDAGVAVDYAVAGAPYLRGSIERVFNSFHTGVISLFEGRTFSNVIDRGDYEAEARASLTIEELGRALVRWVVDVYHNTPHEGLGGQTPRNCWLSLRKKVGVPLSPNEDAMRACFGITVERDLRSEGIQLYCNKYQSTELQRVRREFRLRQKLRVRFDPADLGHISVETPKGWLKVPCTTPEMHGIPLEAHVANRQRMLARYGEEAAQSEAIVKKALADLRRLADESRARNGIASPVFTATNLAHLEAHFSDDRVRVDEAFDGDILGLDEPDDAGVAGDPEAAGETTASLVRDSMPFLGDDDDDDDFEYVLED